MASRRICEYLDGSKVRYVLISHSPAHSAQEVAASAHIPGRDLAKSVVVLLDDRLALAIVSANRSVDLDQLRLASGAASVQLATEYDFAHRFEGCKLGAIPPFGNLFGVETYVDRPLSREQYIAFAAGSLTEVIAMEFADLRRLVRPIIVPISKTPERIQAVLSL